LPHTITYARIDIEIRGNPGRGFNLANFRQSFCTISFIGKPLAWFSAPILLPPVFKVVALLKIELGIFGAVGFFVFDCGSPLENKLAHRKTAQQLK
jgi:hypothetical protein